MSRFVLTAQLQLQAPTNVAQIARQIQSQLNNVTVNVQVQNAAQAQRQLNNVTQSCNNATTAADRMGRAFGASIRRFTAFGIATRAVSLFTSTLSNAVKAAIEFDRELVKIQQVSGATRAELGSLIATVNRLSSSLGVSSQEVLQAGKTLVQAGVSFDDARIALDALAKSALAPNFDSLSETTEGAIAILAQFKQGVNALEGQLSSINAVAGAFAVEAGDLIDVVRRAGGVFKSSGGNLNELLALFTSVRATTRESAESIGTGLRTIFTRIQRPKTIEFLKQFGVQLTDLNGKFVGPFEAVKRLSDALAGLGEGDITFIRIAEELGGFRQIGKVLPLLQQFRTAQEALNVAQNAGTGLTRDALTAQQALAIRITKVKEEFLSLVRAITETSTFQIFANTALNLASALIKLADALKPVIPLLTAVVGIRLARGFGNFAGGVLGGLGGARGFNTGGKVLKFAKGGLVPGSRSGPEDDIEARVSGGEFIMKREAVNRIGVGTLAAMNENRFSRGTTGRGVQSFSQDAQNRLNFLRGKSKLTKSEQDEVLKLQAREKGRDPKSVISGGTLSGTFGASFLRGRTSNPLGSTIAQVLRESNRTGANRLRAAILKKTGAKDLSQVQYQKAPLTTKGTPTYLKSSGSQIFEDEIVQGLPKLFNEATKKFKGSELDPKNVPINQLLSKSAIGSIEGQFFEAFVRRVTNNVIKDSKTDAIFDFNTLAASKKDLNLLFGDQPFVLPNEFKNDASSSSNIASTVGKALTLPGSVLKLFNSGGLVQQFAAGTVGRGVKQSKGILPRPGTAVDSLVKAGGGFVDIDRTLLRTIGDNAYARAKTEEQRQAVLKQYFQNPAARLKDIKQAGLTAFGKELQLAVKSGKLQGSRLRVVSKSQEVPGLRAYITSLFGIPPGNMTFTKGGSKVPFIQGRGPLVDDIVSNARFASGGMVPGTGNRDTVPAMLEQGSFVIKKSSVNSIGASTLSSMPKRAGGGAGTGVPALVTPGEWIYSRKEAQSIGYGKLNTMNKLGKYAKGGVVKRFNRGGTATGGSGSEAGILALSILPATIQSLLPPIDESSGALRKLADSALNTVTVLGSVAFALQAFGVSLTKSSVSKFFGTGKGGAGDIIGGFRSKKYGGRVAGESIAGANLNALIRNSSNQQISNLRQSARDPFLARQRTLRSGGGFDVSGDAIQQQLRNQTANQIRSLRASRPPTPQSLTGKFGNFLGNTAARGGITGRIAGLASSAIAGTGTGAAGGFASAALAATGPLLAIAGAAAGINAIVGSFRDLDGQLKDAIKAQDTAKAQTLAVSQANANAIPLIGNLVGALFDAAGAGDALAGFLTIFGGNTANSIKSTIAAQIATAKANESLKKASEESAKAMEDLQKGTITASEGLQRVATLTADANAARQANLTAIEENAGNRSTVGRGAIARNIFTLGGLIGESSGERNRRIAQEQEKLADENIRLQKESLDAQKPLLRATVRSTVARGGNITDAKVAVAAAGGTTPEILQQQINDLGQRAEKAQLSGDTKTANLLLKQQNALAKQAEELEKEFQNIEKEIKRTQAAFQAMNLGFQGVTAAANAGVVGLNNYLSAQEFGNNALTSSIAVLEASITSAAQGLDGADFDSALKTATDSLKDLGASPKQIAQVENNIRAVNTAQKQFPSALQSLRATLEQQAAAGLTPDLAPDQQKKLIGEILNKQLAAAQVDPKAIKSFNAQFANLKLDEDAINKLLEGDLSVLEGPLQEIGEAALKQLLPVLKAQAEAQDTLNKVLRTKIDLENQLVSAQRQRLDIELEAADIAAKYGGPAVTPEIRRQNVIAQANIQASTTSASALKQGNAAEFTQRNTEIRDRLREISAIREEAAKGDKTAQEKLSGASGVRLEAEQKRLQELAKSDYETTKQLIKLKEDELQIIKEKNKLEQDSIQSLISGDIEKFFEQQAAVGATAAIATGDQRLISSFGASAIAAAAQDIQRQQQAGVQTLFGQQLGGAGGLTERAFGAAIGARGVDDPRLAAIAAGTTAEEVSLQKDIVDLAGTLTNYGDVLLQNAENDYEIAKIQYDAAQLQLEAATQRVKDQENASKSAVPLTPDEVAQTKRFGGVVYASTGKLINFQPRGTDTVPAMLTPGEFVVRREAVQRGNNLAILKSMNSGQSGATNSEVATMARGGVVRYRRNGSTEAESGGGFGDFITKLSQFATSISTFNQQFSANIDKLNNTSFTVKLDASNINVNLNGTSFLGKLKEDLQEELFTEIGRQLGRYRAGNDGELKENRGILNNAPP